MIEDSHRALKRWERAKQFSALESDPVLSSPLAWCKVKADEASGDEASGDEPSGDQGLGESEATTELIRVYIVKLFVKDFVCVKAHLELLPNSVHAPVWLVRGGIDWPHYLKEIVSHYQQGLSVPENFKPVKKITAELLTKLGENAEEDLPLVFEKLREAGVLKPLETLSKDTVPLSLPWNNLKAFFQDFNQA